MDITRIRMGEEAWQKAPSYTRPMKELLRMQSKGEKLTDAEIKQVRGYEQITRNERKSKKK